MRTILFAGAALMLAAGAVSAQTPGGATGAPNTSGTGNPGRMEGPPTANGGGAIGSGSYQRRSPMSQSPNGSAPPADSAGGAAGPQNGSATGTAH